MKSDPMGGVPSRKNKPKLHKPFDDVGAILDEIKNPHECGYYFYDNLIKVFYSAAAIAASIAAVIGPVS